MVTQFQLKEKVQIDNLKKILKNQWLFGTNFSMYNLIADTTQEGYQADKSIAAYQSPPFEHRNS